MKKKANITLINKTSKKSQFYILTAIIIVFIISGLAGIVTYTVIKSEPKNIEELGEDLRIETPMVIDYGVYNGTDVTSLVENFTNKDFASYFASKAGEDTNITFIYGEEDNIKGITYEIKNKGGLTFGNAEWKINNLNSVLVDLKVENDPNDRNIRYVTMAGERYRFFIKPGSTFYFLLKRNEGNETYVEKNNGGKDETFTNNEDNIGKENDKNAKKDDNISKNDDKKR